MQKLKINETQRAALKAAGDSAGAMVALMLAPKDSRALLAQLPPTLEPEIDLHVTLVYLGRRNALTDEQVTGLEQVLPELCAMGAPLRGLVSGLGRFNPDERGLTPVYASFDSPQLPSLRESIVRGLASIAPADDEHGFTPHITLTYIPKESPMPALDLPELRLSFDACSLMLGSARFDLPLVSPAAASLSAIGSNRPIAVKALSDSDAGDWLLDVLGAPFGGPVRGKDLEGQYFDPSTEMCLDRFDPLVLYYHSFDENGKPQGEPEEIGRILEHEMRSDGHWFKVLLNKSSEYAGRVWRAARKNLARASSGTAEHLMRVAADGLIKYWPMIELSLFDAVDGKLPVNAYAVAVPALKARYALRGRPLPINLESISTLSSTAGQPAPDGARPVRV